MKLRELAAILRELDKHPRIGTIAVGDLKVTYHDASPQAAPAEAPEAEPEELELPEGVFDPRAKIDAVYSKARKAS